MAWILHSSSTKSDNVVADGLGWSSSKLTSREGAFQEKILKKAKFEIIF